ncbi:glycosyl hydrolase [Gemmatimonadetes bacterium T265]|nr:glycosyl hydrolase [Gemmatimonadetes bacterium T265]
MLSTRILPAGLRRASRRRAFAGAAFCRAALASAPLASAPLALAPGAAAAQAPVVEKVDPPDWWAGHTINPVRVLIRGRNLGGARLECGRLACANVRANAAGTYVFADVTIPRGAAPGRYPLTLRTGAGSAPVSFAVSPALAAAGRFQGFGPSDVIYLIMPDRFANGDPSNDDPAASKGMFDRGNAHYYHGGDLAGVRRRLPYLKSLGVTALWINPLYDNTNQLDRKELAAGQPTTPYHGYHAVDYYGLEEHFGTMAEFRALVDDAHRQGIKVILDMVENHTSAYHPWVTDPPTPTWYHGTEARHLANTFQVWTVPDPHAPAAERAETLDGWFVNILPDLNQDDPETARYLIQNTLWWVGQSGMDGIRQDTWPYVPRRFWRDWMGAIKAQYPALAVVGEVSEGDPTIVSFFQGGRAQYDGVDDRVDALFDFPLYYAVRDAFARGRSMRGVAQVLAHDWLYPNPNALVTFSGLHDMGRFMSEPGATADGLRLAFTFLFTARGTPMLYYGDEIGMLGGNDPDNRRDFPGGWAGDARDAFETSGRTAAEQAVWGHVEALLRLRASRPDLARAATVNLFVGEQTYVYRRGRTAVALNNDTTPTEVRLPAALLTGGAAALGPAVVGGCAAPRRDGNAVVVAVPARTGCVF